MKLKINIPYQKVVGIQYVIDISNGFTDYKKYIEGPYEDLYCLTIKSNDNCIVKTI